nr:reverse transcriptase domain-containing protein [Tanacetum cinerariifolium]
MWDELRIAFISRFSLALFDRILGEIQAFSPHENETLTEAWLRMKEMLRNCHGHNLSKGNIIKIFYHGLNEITQEALNATAGGIFFYKTPNQAYELIEDKVVLKFDWAKNQKTKSSLKKTVAFSDEGSSNSDTDRIMARMYAMTMKMDALYKEFQSRSKQPNPDHNDSDKHMSLEEEAKFMQTFRRTCFYNDYRDRDSNHDNWRSSGRNDYNRDNYRSNSDDKPDLQKQLSDFIKLNTRPILLLAGKQSARPSGSLHSNTQPNLKVTIIPGPLGVVHVSSSTRVEPSTSNLNPVRIILDPAGLVQQAKLLKEKVFILDPNGDLMSTQQYMDKVVKDVGDDDDIKSAAWVSATNYVNTFGGTVTGCLGDVNNFLNNGKLELVVGIVKSCSPNMLGDLNVTMKDLSGTIPGTIHHKVIGKGGYGKDIIIGAAMILTNVSVFSLTPSKHYLDITMRNVVEVFRKDTVLGNGSG